MKVWSYSTEEGLAPIEVEDSFVEALMGAMCFSRSSYSSIYDRGSDFVVHLRVAGEERFILVESDLSLFDLEMGGRKAALIRSLLPPPPCPNVYRQE